jgi:hypothetical protein
MISNFNTHIKYRKMTFLLFYYILQTGCYNNPGFWIRLSRPNVTLFYEISCRLLLKRPLAPIQAPITVLRTCGGALYTDADSPRPGAGRSATWRRARVPYLTGRTVRVCAGAAEFADGASISLPGGTPSGRRDSGCCLGLVGHPRHL